MKKRLIYICMFASLLTFSSCNEALDVAPDGRLSLDEVFQDPDLTKAYFSTCFDYLPKKSLRYHFWSNYPVALSDEAWDCTDGSGAGFAHAASGNCTTTDFYLDVRRDMGDTYSEGGYWQLYWGQIRIINTFLQRAATAAIPRESDRAQKVYLSRPWRPYAQAVYIHCDLGKHILPVGWNNWGKKENEETVFYAEYRNTGEGAATASRASFGKQLNDIGNYNEAQILAGDDGWNPVENGNVLLQNLKR